MKKQKILSLLLAIAMLCTCITGNMAFTAFALGNPTITVESGEGDAGDEVTVAVVLSNNPGICTAYLSIHYDEALTLTKAEDTGLLLDSVFGKLLTANPYKVTWDDSLAAEDNAKNGAIVNLTFKVADTAADGKYKIWITYKNGEIYNLDLDDITFDTVEGYITVGEKECEHSFTNYVSNNDATCTLDGTKTAKCDKCDVTDTVPDVGSALGHSFKNYVSNNDATCTQDGTKTAKCERCDEIDTITDTGSSLGHSYTNYVSNHNATCTEDGTKTAKCNHCDETDTIADVGSALGHSFTHYTYNNDATYSADGTETAKCDRCDAIDSRTKVGSKLVDTIAPKGEITVNKNGFKSFINTISFGLFCKDKYDVSISGTDDETGVAKIEYYLSATAVSESDIASVTEWIEDDSFSIEDEGKYIVYAKITDNNGNITYISTDGMVVDKTVPAINGISNGTTYCSEQSFTVGETNLSSVTINDIPQNITNSSYVLAANRTTYIIVVTDKAGNSSSVTVKVNSGHTFENYVSNNDATCKADGTKTAHCKYCDATDTITDVGSKGQHSFSNYISNNDATCTQDGTKTATCDHCDEIDTITDVGSALGHSFTHYTSNNNATCTQDGTKTATCDRCDAADTKADVGTALGHSFTHYTYNNDATYTADGTESAKCDRCDVTDTRIKSGTKLVDTIAPYGTIKVKKNEWKSFINTITFGLFYKENLDVTVISGDDETGVAKVEYYVSSEAVSEDDITSVTAWTEYSAFNLESEGNYIVYVKITDNNNNVTYISSNGMSIDKTAPAISGIVDGTSYCSAQTFSVTESNLKTVTVNNAPVELVNGSYALAANGSTYVIVVTDEVGLTATATVKVYNGHSFTNYTSNNNATCQADGTKTAFCDHGCGVADTITDVGSKTDHSFTNYVSNNDATCTADGTKTAKCDHCDKTDTKADVGSKLGHSFTDYVSNHDATCTEDGTKTAKCDRCDASDTKADVGSKLGHSFTNYLSNNDAACTEDGTKTAKCDRCDAIDTITDTGSALGHSFTHYSSNNDATCTADGTKTAACDRCDATDIKTDVGTALGHSFTHYAYNNDATYTSDGTESAKCDRCDVTDTRTKAGTKLVDTIAPKGEIKVQENGWKAFVNTISFGLFCKDKFDVTITASDDETGVAKTEYYLSETPISEEDISSVTEWTEYSAFSLEAEGKYIVYAKITDKNNNVTYISSDGMVVDKTIPVISGISDGATYCSEQSFTVDETYLKSVAVNGTPVNAVNGKYTLAANGSKYTVVVTDKADNTATVTVTVNNGHSFETYSSNGDATCTADGTKTATCKYCNATDTVADTGSALGHSFTNYTSNNDATCTKDGTKTAKCDRCDKTNTIADVGSALGHAWDEGTVTKNPSCTAEGEMTYHCTRTGCIETKKEAIEKLAHDYKDTVVAPTCIEQGYTLHECKNCDEQHKDTYTNATGHKVTEWTVTKEPTKTSEGERTGECSVCNETITEAIAKLVSKVDSDKIETSFTSDIKDGAVASVEAVGETGLDENVVFVVKEITNSASTSEKDELNKKFDEAKKGSFGLAVGDEMLSIFDLNLVLREYDSNGNITGEKDYTPSGKIKVTIPVPMSILENYTNISIMHFKDDGSVEVIACSVTSDGTITFETDGFSNYAIVGTKTEAKNPGETTDPGNSDSPQTGDNSNVLIYMILFAASLCALVFLGITSRKRHAHSKR